MESLNSDKLKNTHGGYRHGSGRGKKGLYRGFYCDSTYELAFVVYSLDHQQIFQRCTRIYDYFFEDSWHKYYPDFELEDGSLVEVKGYHTKQVDAKIAAVTDRSIKVLYRKDLDYCFEYILNTYGYTDETIFQMYENSENQVELYSAIKTSILDKSLTLTQIAKEYNVPRSLVSKINTGKVAFSSNLSYPLYQQRFLNSNKTRRPKGQIRTQRKEVVQSICIVCGVEITQGATYCTKCYKSLVNTSILNKEAKASLLEELFQTSLTAVGKKYGISANAVIKWLKANGLPSHIREFKNWYSSTILNIPITIQTKVKKVNQSSLPIAMCDLVSNETIKVFNNAKEASSFLGKSRKEAGDIVRVCNNIRKSAYGYKWRFIDN